MFILRSRGWGGDTDQLTSDPLISVDFYSAVRQKWVNQANKLRNITVVSIGGGYRDYLVRSGLTSLPCSPKDPNKLSLVVGSYYPASISPTQISSERLQATKQDKEAQSSMSVFVSGDCGAQDMGVH